MKELLRTLVEIPTTTTNLEANHEALDFIDRYLSERGLFVRRHEFDGHESLVATTQNTKTPTIMLAAHLDVVPAPPRLFKLVEKDGKFYGRGTCDMKFAIAAYLQLVDDLQEDLHHYDFGIMITTDEETGGRYGVAALLKAGYHSQACVLPDGGENWALEQSAKGILWMNLTAIGKSSHASRPWEGENAVEKMLLFLQAMQQELFVEQNEDTNTCNIGTIQGGSTPNQVPEACSARIDIRFLNKKEQHRLFGRITELCDMYDITYETVLNDSAINIDLADPFVVSFAQSVEKLTGQPLVTTRSKAASDARYFAAHGIPALVIYPPGGGLHSNEEWIDVKGFYLFKDLILDYLAKTAVTSSENSLKSLTSVQ